MASLSQFIHSIDNILKEKGVDKTKLSQWVFITMILIGIWISINSTGRFMEAYHLIMSAREVPQLKRDDLELYRNLMKLPEQRIGTINENIKTLKSLASFPYGTVKIEEITNKKEEKKENLENMGLDRVGTFKKYKITFSGGVIEQMEFLKALNKLSNFILIEKIVGDAKGVQINLSVYGGLV